MPKKTYGIGPLRNNNRDLISTEGLDVEYQSIPTQLHSFHDTDSTNGNETVLSPESGYKTGKWPELNKEQ